MKFLKKHRCIKRKLISIASNHLAITLTHLIPQKRVLIYNQTRKQFSLHRQGTRNLSTLVAGKEGEQFGKKQPDRSATARKKEGNSSRSTFHSFIPVPRSLSARETPGARCKASEAENNIRGAREGEGE